MTSRFEGSCLELPQPCQVTTTTLFYTDACDCHRFYQCDNGNYLRVACAPGTFFDHILQSCIALRDEKYEDYGCDGEEPWLRCEDVSGHFPMNFLSRVCNPSSPGTGNGGGNSGGGGDNSGGASDGNGGSSGGDDTGAIVGGVVGGLVVVAIIAVLLVVYFKKRKNGVPRPRAHNYHVNSGTTQHERHAAKEDEEEVYAVIDEKEMTSVDETAERERHTYVNSGVQRGEDGGYSLAKEIPQQNNHLTGPEEHRDDLSRTVSVEGREIAIQDSDGYQIAYPSGSMPKLPQHTVERNTDPSAPPPDYFQLEKDPYYDS